MTQAASSQRRWFARRRKPTPKVPYEIPCACGQVLRGNRGGKHKVLTCSGCGRQIFVFPRSPWPPCTEEDQQEITPTRSPANSPRAFWWGPLIAGGCSLVLVVLTLTILWPYLTHRPQTPSNREASTVGQILQHQQAGQRALELRQFHSALYEMNKAVSLRDRQPRILSVPQNHTLNQWQRQCDLLARLLEIPLEEILEQRLAVTNEKEWQSRFTRYRSRTVIFDDGVQWDVEGKPSLVTYVVSVEGTSARIALEDLKLFRQLPMDRLQRMFFGARLAECSRDKKGQWVFHFDPDSAVLLTDRQAALAAYPAPLNSNQFRELELVLRWQAEQLKDLDLQPAPEQPALPFVEP